MKEVIILIVYCAYVLCQTGTSSQASTAKATVVGAKCTSDADCPTNECCVHSPLTQHQRKRLIFNSDFFHHDHGYCRMHRKENQTCMPIGHDILNPSLYEFHCPCEAGLECRGIRVHESQHQITHENPICQQPES